MYCIKLCFNFHLSSFSEKCGEVIQVFIISYLSIWCTFENVLLQTVDAYHLILLGCGWITRHQHTCLVHLFFFFLHLEQVYSKKQYQTPVISYAHIQKINNFTKYSKFCVDIYIYLLHQQIKARCVRLMYKDQKYHV